MPLKVRKMGVKIKASFRDVKRDNTNKKIRNHSRQVKSYFLSFDK